VRVTDLLDVVALAARSCRQYNVGMTGRRGPLKIMNDKCLQITPGLHHLVAVLVAGEWISAESVGKPHIRIVRPRPIKVERLAGVLEHLDNARHWN